MTYCKFYEIYLAQAGEPAMTHSSMFKTQVIRPEVREEWAARLIADGDATLVVAELVADVKREPPYHREKIMRHVMDVTRLDKSLLELGKATVAKLAGVDWFEIAELQEEGGNLSCYLVSLPKEHGEWLDSLTDKDCAFQMPLRMER